MRRKLIAGNWKMNGTRASLAEVDALLAAHPSPACDILLCPPATLIAPMAEAVRGTPLMIGAQDCHAQPSGAHTGDLSAAMLAEAGASHVILGHSERRADHYETDADVLAKADAAHAARLIAVICVGETEAERDAGQELDVIGAQLAASVPAGSVSSNTVIAYEPVWAIGSGRTPTDEQIAIVHRFIREHVVERFGPDGEALRLLYGGSVKPGNASAIFKVANVDGALVGGASLKAKDFGAIVAAVGD